MHIDRERFLRAALLLNLGGAPLATGCIIAEDGAEDPAAQQPYDQTSGGEQPAQVQAEPVQGQPVQVVGPQEQRGGPVYEGGGPVVEGGGPVVE